MFCGKGGWTDGLLAAGFRVIGFDIKEFEGYKGEFVKRDILQMIAEEIGSYNPSFICCSSPCEEFSVHGMKMFHPNPKYPETGIRLFNHAKMLCESAGCLYVMENVRSAKDFVGHSVNHCGPFHLWGNGVPAIIPPECYKVKKKTCPEKKRLIENTAKASIIPISLSCYIGQFAMQSLTLAVK